MLCTTRSKTETITHRICGYDLLLRAQPDHSLFVIEITDQPNLRR